jgi:hypothetical protein
MDLTDKWMLTIGEHFGVTKNGEVFASKLSVPTVEYVSLKVYEENLLKTKTLIAEQISATTLVANTLYVTDENGKEIFTADGTKHLVEIAGWTVD